ncbi:hypothetical protein AB0M79_27180 [Polymorphospora sp. NPDC051019]|uniref:hypothetical protein n=1 Tax=Polymorphospora sp. NPDC051019 TaxID=3155725 RepID=UPI003443F0D3
MLIWAGETLSTPGKVSPAQINSNGWLQDRQLNGLVATFCLGRAGQSDANGLAHARAVTACERRI